MTRPVELTTCSTTAPRGSPGKGGAVEVPSAMPNELAPIKLVLLWAHPVGNTGEGVKHGFVTRAIHFEDSPAEALGRPSLPSGTVKVSRAVRYQCTRI